MGTTYLMHSAKGSTWKNHKYVKKVNGVYYYAKDKVTEAKDKVVEVAKDVIGYDEEEDLKIAGKGYDEAWKDQKKLVDYQTNARSEKQQADINKAVGKDPTGIKAYAAGVKLNAAENAVKLNEARIKIAMESVYDTTVKYNKTPLAKIRKGKEAVDKAIKTIKNKIKIGK